MQESQKNTYSSFTLNGLRADPASGQIIGPGGVIRLEPRVMALLQVLAGRPGEVVSRAELMTDIWPGEGVYDEALTQCIYQLRHQLGEAGGSDEYRRLVKTVPKRGYVLQGDVERLHSQAANETVPSVATERAEDRKDPARAPQVRTYWKSAAAALILLLALFGAWGLYQSNNAPEAAAPLQPAWTIAVLPFLPMIPQQSDPVLELGMADTLITRLSSINQIVVRPVNSVRRFSKPDRDSLQAGLMLGVDAVVDGTIQRSGDELRVTARLLRVSDGTALWADSFDEPLSSVFTMQDQICARIAAALKLQLEPVAANLASSGTHNTEAYELFLKGRYHLVLLTRPDLLASLDYFQQAVDLDPNYAQAWLGLASVNFRLPLAGEVPPANHYDLAREAALQALSIDDSLAEGHAFLGWVSFWSEHDWAASEKHFQRANQLNPNEFEGHLGYAHLLSNTGRSDEALVEVRRAREINPLFPMGAVLEAGFMQNAGMRAEALRMIEVASQQNPGFWLARLNLAEFYLEAGRTNEAMDEVLQARKLAPDSNYVKANQVRILHAVGKSAEAEALVAEMVHTAEQSYVSPYYLAMAYMGLGDHEQALYWLESTIEENDPMLVFLGVKNVWDNLRGRADFEDILQRVNLVDVSN